MNLKLLLNELVSILADTVANLYIDFIAPLKKKKPPPEEKKPPRVHSTYDPSEKMSVQEWRDYISQLRNKI